MRILALDFGEKRIGLATSDATGSVVTGRRTLKRINDTRTIAELVRFCQEEEIDAMVLGIPRSPEGVESPFAQRIRSFGHKLGREIGLPVIYHEETLTSWEAERAAPSSAKEEIDRSAAAILLTDYLSHASGRTA